MSSAWSWAPCTRSKHRAGMWLCRRGWPIRPTAAHRRPTHLEVLPCIADHLPHHVLGRRGQAPQLHPHTQGRGLVGEAQHPGQGGLAQSGGVQARSRKCWVLCPAGPSNAGKRTYALSAPCEHSNSLSTPYPTLLALQGRRLGAALSHAPAHSCLRASSAADQPIQETPHLYRRVCGHGRRPRENNNRRERGNQGGALGRSKYSVGAVAWERHSYGGPGAAKLVASPGYTAA